MGETFIRLVADILVAVGLFDLHFYNSLSGFYVGECEGEV